MKVYDCFTFFNEINILDVRLAEHDPFVDYFVITEGNRTFTGKNKPFYFDISDKRYDRYRHKIISHKIELEENPQSPWHNEISQRNGILNNLPYKDDDLLLISDVDEIVSRHYWTKILFYAKKKGVCSIRMRVLYYFINLFTPEDCTAAKMYTGKMLRENGFTADAARQFTTNVLPRVYSLYDSYGWHFSYIGDKDFIRNKIQCFSHQEYNNDKWTSQEKIKTALLDRKDLFGRYSRFTAHKIDKSWPLDMLNNPFWNSFTLVPDTLTMRLAEKVKRKLTFLKNGVIARLQPNYTRQAK